MQSAHPQNPAGVGGYLAVRSWAFVSPESWYSREAADQTHTYYTQLVHRSLDPSDPPFGDEVNRLRAAYATVDQYYRDPNMASLLADSPLPGSVAGIGDRTEVLTSAALADANTDPSIAVKDAQKQYHLSYLFAALHAWREEELAGQRFGPVVPAIETATSHIELPNLASIASAVRTVDADTADGKSFLQMVGFDLREASYAVMGAVWKLYSADLQNIRGISEQLMHEEADHVSQLKLSHRQVEQWQGQLSRLPYPDLADAADVIGEFSTRHLEEAGQAYEYARGLHEATRSRDYEAGLVSSYVDAAIPGLPALAQASDQRVRGAWLADDFPDASYSAAPPVPESLALPYRQTHGIDERLERFAAFQTVSYQISTTQASPPIDDLRDRTAHLASRISELASARGDAVSFAVARREASGIRNEILSEARVIVSGNAQAFAESQPGDPASASIATSSDYQEHAAYLLTNDSYPELGRDMRQIAARAAGSQLTVGRSRSREGLEL